jgi:amino acid transporter
MEWLVGFVIAWWWLIAAFPIAAVMVLTAVLFLGSKGPYPKITVHEEEKTFIDSNSGKLEKRRHFII